MVDFLIRQGSAADLAAIQSIQSASERASQWAPADYAACDVRVAECDSRVTAFLVTRLVAPGEYEILNIAVAPEFRRKGIGAALVQTVVAGHPGTWFLEVRESNVVARKLYTRLGFKQVGIRQNYYEKPPEAAIVMRFFS